VHPRAVLPDDARAKTVRHPIQNSNALRRLMVKGVGIVTGVVGIFSEALRPVIGFAYMVFFVLEVVWLIAVGRGLEPHPNSARPRRCMSFSADYSAVGVKSALSRQSWMNESPSS